MENWIIGIIEDFGYIGILLLILAENLFPPIPSEVILLFGGFMTAKAELSVAGVIWFSTLGSVLGAVALYGVGRLADVDRLEGFVLRYGKFLRLTVEDLHKAERWFDRRGVVTVFFCRFIPLIRSLISIPAGMMKMNFAVFLLFTALGTLIWNAVLVSAGAAVGGSWHEIIRYFDAYSSIVYILLVAGGAAVVVLWISKRRR